MGKRYRDLNDYLTSTETTQAEFAARVGVQQAAISRYANGVQVPSLVLALRIAEEANIPIESLAVAREDGAAT